MGGQIVLHRGELVRLTRAEWTEAVRGFARRHGYYARTVRGMTTLRLRAGAEYLERRAGQ
jgi:hypothetical protein